VAEHQLVAVLEPERYVSRAAYKLLAALDAFELEVSGRTALDVGASTGGFTQVLLERGASTVIALDVGHDQLDPSLRADARVVAIEGFNARSLTRAALEDAAPGVPSPSLVVADLSFIPLGLVLPALVKTMGTDADYIVLVKPQFEVGRGGIREGIVREAGLRTSAVNGVLDAAWALGLPTAGVLSSPVEGSAGNHEYLAWFSTAVGGDPTEWRHQVAALTSS
jgi:23S rRNA (cytidine1920-2'-O)/16S rRNA (cytidine1409-2'-O)-methyltransferase